MHGHSSDLRPSFDYLNFLLTGCSFGSTCAPLGEAIRGKSQAQGVLRP